MKAKHKKILKEICDKKSQVEDFADTIKDDPEEIIAWAYSEIEAYERLIAILEKRINKKNI